MKQGIAIATLVLALGSASGQEAKIFKSLSPDETEEFLKKQGIEAKRLDAKGKGTTLFDYQKNNVGIRLYNFDGKDLMLDAVFPGLPLARLNQWNVKAKFSRVCLNRDAKGEFTTLESNFDLIGGVTEGALKQFLLSFDDEVKLFQKFAGDSANDDQIFTPVTNEKLESILKGLGVAFEKGDVKNATYFDFAANGFKLRLVNFGGKDLMIDAHFKKIPLEDLNQWNLEKKFIRAVGYSVKGQEYSALECNLDCEVGTTDGILRNFIVGFQEDVKQFAKFVQGK